MEHVTNVLVSRFLKSRYKASIIHRRPRHHFPSGLSMQLPDSSKSSKSVTFTSTDVLNPEVDLTGMLIEPDQQMDKDTRQTMQSISMRMPQLARQPRLASGSLDDMDLWLAFLAETGILQSSDLNYQQSDQPSRQDTKVDDPDMMLHEMDYYKKIQAPRETITTNIRDDYDGIHRLCPGLFWDTIMMDNPELAYSKVKNIIRDIVNSQNSLKPMFDIDFANLNYYPTVEKRLENICHEIAPHRLFY